MSQNILVIGGSRNIGYYSSIRFLDAGANVTFLLRSPNVFDADEVIQRYVKSGKAHLLKGDALVQSDVQHAWDDAARGAAVDLCLFTVGGTPKFRLTKGFVIDPPNLVTESLINTLCTMPRTSPQPRIITLSSTGLTPSAHAVLPLPLKVLYGALLGGPHRDKVGSERIIAHCAGLTGAGTLNRALVIRAAMLTDGDCLADKKAGGKPVYRVSEPDISMWTISRKDVAHFVVDAMLNRWEEFENKRISLGY
ncbi:hypothetical protein BD779DRAFT_1707023 [Infundibulicybe gibba]|nr:hypothetical protein BD779DRAFT_1707023 [Infundibulicybe gibba]